MLIKDRHIALFCNLVLLTNALILCAGLNDYVSALIINAVIYIVPGVAWIGLFKKEIKDSVSLIFFIFVISFLILILILSGQVISAIEPRPLSFIIWIALVTNFGIFFTKPAGIFQNFRYDPKEAFILFLSMVCIYSCIFAGMKTFPEKLDLDGEHQGTAYGLIHELKPYLTSDDFIGSSYYFAHPPLTNIFNAFSIFLMGKTNDYKYFYDSARLTEKVLSLSPGDKVTALFMNENYWVQNVNGQHFILKKMAGSDQLEYTYTKQSLIEFINWQDQNRFFGNPRVFPARASNIFASILIFFVLYKLIAGLTQSRLLGIVGGYAYIFTPGIFVRSCLSEHVAFTNCMMAFLAYQYFRPEAFESSKRPYVLLKYLPGIIAGLINQKIVVMVLPIFLIQLMGAVRDKSKEGFLKYILRQSTIPIGFALGSILFWIYGASIDFHAFVLSHVKVHLFDRLFHVNSLFAEDYPSLLRLWYEFKIEFLYFPITIFSMIFCLMKYAERNVYMFSAWAISGAVLFSIVDWKQTNHLTQIVMPLLICLMIYIEKQPMTYKRILKVIVGVFLIYSFWKDIQLLNNFSVYNPTSGW